MPGTCRLEDKGSRFFQNLVTTFEAAWCFNPRSLSLFICGSLCPIVGKENNRTVFVRKVLNKLDQTEGGQPRNGGN